MRIFVAGSTGVLGGRILPLLAGQGHQVTALTRRSDRAGMLRSLGADPAVADAFEPVSLAAAVQQASPDVIMHQLTDLTAGNIAANADLWVRGTRNLMDAAHAAGVGRVIAQSIAWAYSPGSEQAGERTPLDLGAPGPRRTTVHAVAALEQATQEAAEWVVLRYGMLYGPDTWYEPRGSKAADARAGNLVINDDVTSFVHIDDAAAAAVQALAWPSGPVNVCDDEPAAGRDWVPAFCQAVGAPVPARSSPDARAPWARGADNHHARRDLAWTPRYPSWRQGFHAMPAPSGTGTTRWESLVQKGPTEASRAMVAGFFRALRAGDMVAVRAAFAPDATWILRGGLPASGTWTGPDGIMDGFFPQIFSRLDPEVPVVQDARRIIADGEYAVAEWTTHARTRDGRSYDSDYAGVFRVVEGQITAVTEYLDTAYAQRVLFSG